MSVPAWTCPLPLQGTPFIVLGHGGGGRLTADLVEHLFLPAFSNPHLEPLGDAAVLPPLPGRLAMTTDGHVVRPLFFPGGCIGDLAVNGTINDLAMVGAMPRHLTASFILEEGLPIADLGRIAERMGAAARAAGVTLVAGDVKVVERGHGDGCFISTTGLGTIAEPVQLGPRQVRPGDVVLVSGPVGNHGIAILSVRAGLEFETTIASDTAALHGLVQALLTACPEVRMLRDPTRGGLAACLNEIARQANVGIEIDEAAVPVEEQVRAACEILGLDPLLVANEGRLVALVPAAAAEAVLATMRAHPLAVGAVRIGDVTQHHPGIVALRTTLGALRVVPMPLGEQLPRIC
jgi:hydrogenase expression/formation protein HypE